MGEWLKKWGLKLISTQVVVEVKVGVELGNMAISIPSWGLAGWLRLSLARRKTQNIFQTQNIFLDPKLFFPNQHLFGPKLFFAPKFF